MGLAEPPTDACESELHTALGPINPLTTVLLQQM